MLSFLEFNLTYLLLTVPFLLLSLWAGSRVKGTFAKYSKIPIRSGYTGHDTALAMLRAAGIHDVQIESVPGMLSDHYDPTRRVVALSEDILHGNSAAAVAVAAHEVGHALQHAEGYQPMSWRHSLVPVVNIGSSLALPLLIAGLLLQVGGLAWLGVIAFSVAVVFHMVTLPVEYDASFRAFKVLERSGIVAVDEMPGVRKTLYAAGFTYVAAALASVGQLLYFVMHAASLGRD
jgi:hypothetical protein